MNDLKYKIKRNPGQNIYLDKIFKYIFYGTAILILLVTIGFFITLVTGAWPALQKFGLGFLWGNTWDPVKNNYSALPFIVGTLITSFIALAISFPFIISISFLLGEYYPKGWFSDFLKNAIELIAAIPSVIFGFWGLFVLVPIVRKFEIMSNIVPYGVGILTTAIVLAIMIIPYAASMGREIIKLVPPNLKEGAFALGATKWEVIKFVIVPYARNGISAGLFLSLGRALSETMAVAMLIGNNNHFPKGILMPGNTLAGIIASEFAESADSKIHVASLIELGLILFVLTVAINMTGKFVISKFAK